MSKPKKERRRQDTIVLTKRMTASRVNFQYLYGRAGLGHVLLRKMKAALDVHAAVLDNAKTHEAKIRGTLDDVIGDIKKARSPKRKKILEQVRAQLQKQLDDVREDITILSKALDAIQPLAEEQQKHTTELIHNLASAEAKYTHERWKPIREMMEKEQKRRKKEGPKEPVNLFAGIDPKASTNVFAIPVPLIERDDNGANSEETTDTSKK